MNFKEAIETCLIKKFLTIQGRASRPEFWYFFAFSTLVSIGLLIIGGLAFIQSAMAGTVIFSVLGLYWLGAIIPSITVTIRRLHDLDKSGLWYLIAVLLSVIPLIGFICSIGIWVCCAFKGTEGNNRFDDPKNATFSIENSIKLFKEDFNKLISKFNSPSQPAAPAPSPAAPAPSPAAPAPSPAAPAPSPAAPAPSPAATDNLEKLEKLHELKEKGILTEEEFQSQKKTLLGG